MVNNNFRTLFSNSILALFNISLIALLIIIDHRTTKILLANIYRVDGHLIILDGHLIIKTNAW